MLALERAARKFSEARFLFPIAPSSHKLVHYDRYCRILLRRTQRPRMGLARFSQPYLYVSIGAGPSSTSSSCDKTTNACWP